jgi:hypothetical protein
MISLISYHISNIAGICEAIGIVIYEKDTQEVKSIKQVKKRNFRKLAISKYDNDIEYWIGHIFFLIVMFLINSIYTAELNPKTIDIENGDGEKVSYGNLTDEQQNNDQTNENEEENKSSKSNKQKNKLDRKPLIYDTTYSINDCDSSFILRNDDDIKRSEIIERRIKRTIAEKILPKYIVNNKYNKNKEEDFSFTFLTLAVKGIFMHLDKITLIVMYLVSVYAVNVIHVI